MGVVAGDPGVVLVPIGDLFPQVDDPVLEMPVGPEARLMRRVVRVPMVILRSRQGVEVDHGVDAIASARVDHPVQVAKAVRLDLERTVVVLEVPVVDGQPDAVQARVGEQADIGLGEERGQQPLEEHVVQVLAEDVAHGSAHERFIRGVAGYASRPARHLAA